MGLCWVLWISAYMVPGTTRPWVLLWGCSPLIHGAPWCLLTTYLWGTSPFLKRKSNKIQEKGKVLGYLPGITPAAWKGAYMYCGFWRLWLFQPHGSSGDSFHYDRGPIADWPVRSCSFWEWFSLHLNYQVSKCHGWGSRMYYCLETVGDSCHTGMRSRNVSALHSPPTGLCGAPWETKG